jgi:hypothetical protein
VLAQSYRIDYSYDSTAGGEWTGAKARRRALVIAMGDGNDERLYRRWAGYVPDYASRQLISGRVLYLLSKKREEKKKKKRETVAARVRGTPGP